VARAGYGERVCYYSVRRKVPFFWIASQPLSPNINHLLMWRGFGGDKIGPERR